MDNNDSHKFNCYIRKKGKFEMLIRYPGRDIQSVYKSGVLQKRWGLATFRSVLVNLLTTTPGVGGSLDC